MDLIKNIQITATWLAEVNNDFDKNLFRTPELMPDTHYIDIPPDQLPVVLDKLCATRAELLNRAGITLIAVENLHHYGRITYLDIHQSIPDGVAIEETYFFF